MGDQLDSLFSSSCRMVWNILLVSFACVLLPTVSSANAESKILYVSKAYGNDTIINGCSNNCQNSTLPCKTLSYVIGKSSSNDLIMVDSTNTVLQPYDNCSSKLVQGSLSFKSWKGFAVVNCSGHVLVFDGSLTKGKVTFQGLTFINTFVNLTDVSLNVTNCTFGSFERNTSYLYIISISAKNLSSTINISLTNSSFMKNNSAGCLKVVNSIRAVVFLQIEKVFILNNTPRFAASLIFIVGPLNFNFLNSGISNTTFSEQVTQPSVIRFGPNAAMNHASIKDETTSILSFRISGGNFCGNGAKILLASFIRSAHVMVINTNFSRNTDKYSPGGVMVLISEDGAESFNVHISNCWFDSNKKISYTNLINVTMGNSVVSNISLDTCHFNKNKNILSDAFQGTGSIVYVEGQRFVLNVSHCKFELNQAGAVTAYVSQYSNLYFGHTHVAFCSFWNDVGESFGGMISVIFNYDNYPSFPKWIKLQEFNLWIEDCEFRNNSARMVGAGAVAVNYLVLYQRETQSVGKVTIRRSTFIGNLAHSGTGALQISSNLDCDIFDTVFRENAGSEAGAICFTGVSILLNNCTLDSNFGGYTTSTLNGGSLRLIKRGSALIQNSRILQGKINQSFGRNLNFHGGVSVSSDNFGSINISNSSFDFFWKPSTERAIVMEITGQTNFTLDEATFIRCPKSYKIIKITSGSHYGQSFECYLCSMNTYSVDRGIYRVSKRHRAKCLLCPYGARCTVRGLQALPNFWGYKVDDSNPPRIAFSQCPMGYCCQAERHQKSCFPYWACNSQRQGRLCGECKAGFTETLFTASCRRSQKCNDFWFWPIAVIFVLGFSFYLVIQPDFVSILWNKVTWFYHSSSQEIAPDDKVLNLGFERIVFFYYQATDILFVQSSYDVWDKYLSRFVLGFFNFEVRLNNEGFACPFPGLDPVSKVFFHSLGVISVLFAIPFIFMCHCLFCFCLRKDIPKTGLYLSAFFKGTFLGYAVLAEKSMKLLKCVTVNGVNCLFVNCNIQCYTWWQTLLITLIVIYFIPFVLVLFFGSYKLFNKRISVLHFILAFFLPLPFLSYWFINRRTLRTKHVPDSESRDAIRSLVIGSYRLPDHMNRGAIYWESVLIGRMLVLILANVLIKEPFLRSLTLLFICILNLSIHIYIFPFELPIANIAESISLFCLVLMAMFNLPFMGYLSEGVVPTGPISHIMKIFSWCQAGLVAFLPCVCVLLALAALLSQTVKLIFFISTWLRCVCCRVWCCRQCLLDTRDRDELVNPLITS